MGKITNNSKNIIFSSFCVLASFAVVLSVVFGGARIAYKVKLNGKPVCVISDKQVYYAAVDLVADIVEGENVKDVLPQADIETVFTLESNFDDCDKMVDTIIDNTDEIVLASRLVVDGAAVGCADTESLEEALAARRSAYTGVVGAAASESAFCAEVLVEEGYYLSSEVSDISDLAPAISALNVKTTAKISENRAVAYKTVTNRTSDQKVGYRNVEQCGQEGIECVTKNVVYINGELTGEITESIETVKEPVNEIITVGTASTGSTYSLKTGFIFPLPSGTWEISCPYGKDGHKGVDLRAPSGTAIMAVAAGTVVSAGRSGSYGNCVVIDHGNGLSTLYAHASKIYVSVGDKVSAGEVIALVGSTGYSTGYHLHFEVHVGDDRINPQPYIGL
ncbi:MAG: peptidoglycan DD-metalloendopeptidase family protein [Clostridia bacterium]|nr:peptidoglycan DD-metalloendopeptidase family protein [Clostridia bacterium]